MSDLPMDGTPQASVPVETDRAHIPEPSSGRAPIEPDPQGVEVEAEAEAPEPEKKPKKEPKSIDDALKDAIKKSEAKGKEKAAKEGAEGQEGEEDAPKEEAKKAARGKDGKFAPAQASEGDGEEGEQRASPKAARPSTYSEPPSRFHESAKAEWANTPDSVRAEVHRATQELERGIEKYRSQAAEYEEIREYREMAKQHGGTLKSALDNYVGIENLLRQNPMAGLERVVQNLGIRKPDGSPMTLFDVAHSIVKQNPDQRALQQNNTIATLQAKIAQLEGAVQKTQGFVEQQRLTPAYTVMQEFAASNPRFSEVQSEVAQVLKSGVIPTNLPPAERLDRAFKTVIFNLDGEFPSAQTASSPSNTGAQTAAPTTQPIKPAGQKSVSGAPSAVAPKAKTASGNTPSIDEALQRALRKAS